MAERTPGLHGGRCVLDGHGLDENAASSIVPTVEHRHNKSGRGIAWATISSPTRSSLSTPQPASGSGTFRPSSMTCGPRCGVASHADPPSNVTARCETKKRVEIAHKVGVRVGFSIRTKGTPLFPIEYKKYPPSAIRARNCRRRSAANAAGALRRQQLTAEMLTQRDAGGACSALRGSIRWSARAVRAAQHRRRYHSVPWLDGGRRMGRGRSIQTPVCCISIRMKWHGLMAGRTPKPGEVVSGKDIYRTQCAACHGDGRTGAAPPRSLARGYRRASERRPVAIDHSQRYGAHARVPSVAFQSDRCDHFVRQRWMESTVFLSRRTQSRAWDLQYRFTGFNKFLDIDGYPAISPPWGTLNAINMNTGEYAWKILSVSTPSLAAKGIKEYR